MTLTDLNVIIDKHLLLADEGIIKLVCATIVASRMPITPPWIMIVGSSSGGKSAILNSLKDCRGITPIDDLTTNTLLSGYKKSGGKEASLLFNLPADPIFLFKDFSTILTKNKETQEVIFSQLRKVWDGDFNKSTGMGDTQNWEGRVGLLGASTSKIYSVLPQLAEVGERLVLYHFQMPNRKDVARFASKHLDDANALIELRTAFRVYLDGIKLPTTADELPAITDELNEELIDLSDLATRARSSIERDQFSRDKNVVMAHDLEMPMRLLKTIKTVSMGLMVMNGNLELQALDKRILYRLALDSIPRNRKLMLNYLTNNGQVKLDAFETQLNMERGLAMRTADDLHSLGMTIKSRNMGNQWVYQLKPEFEEVINRFSEIANIDKELLRGNIVDEVSDASAIAITAAIPTSLEEELPPDFLL